MVIGNNFSNRINASKTAVNTGKTNTVQSGRFKDILEGRINDISGLKFSKHAEQRLQARNIDLSQTQKAKINEAVSKADSKGVKDSLVLMDNLAFVVNVRSRTVITAANSNDLKENVFTNIDGAVII